MVIAAVGIYGVMACIVEQRTPEIGVRLALGAQPRTGAPHGARSARHCSWRIGLAIGLAAGWGLSRFVQAFLFQVEAHDVRVYGGAALVLILAGLVAAFIPARRASNVDPVSVLRWVFFTTKHTKHTKGRGETSPTCAETIQPGSRVLRAWCYPARRTQHLAPSTLHRSIPFAPAAHRAPRSFR